MGRRHVTSGRGVRDSFTSTGHGDRFKRRECGNPEGNVRGARPPCRTQAVPSTEEQIAQMSSSNRS